MTAQRVALAEDLVGMVMAKMSLTYGRRFSNSYDASPETVRAHWAHELAGLSVESIHYALQRLPADYVPNVLQFRLIASQRPPGEFKALPPPKASPAIKREQLHLLRELRECIARPAHRDSLAWAERINANPQRYSWAARKLAIEALKTKGRIE